MFVMTVIIIAINVVGYIKYDESQQKIDSIKNSIAKNNIILSGGITYAGALAENILKDMVNCKKSHYYFNVEVESNSSNDPKYKLDHDTEECNLIIDYN
jgi:hypothetical protein